MVATHQSHAILLRLLQRYLFTLDVILGHQHSLTGAFPAFCPPKVVKR